jgi:hypothetical protein
MLAYLMLSESTDRVAGLPYIAHSGIIKQSVDCYWTRCHYGKSVSEFYANRSLDWPTDCYYPRNMTCPHCMCAINDRLIAKHLASKAGSAGSVESKRAAGRLGGLKSAAKRKEALRNGVGAVLDVSSTIATACHDQAIIAV